MKVAQQPSFTPVVITLETPEELEAAKALSYHYNSAAHCLVKDGQIQAEHLAGVRNFLHSLRFGLEAAT